APGSFARFPYRLSQIAASLLQIGNKSPEKGRPSGSCPREDFAVPRDLRVLPLWNLLLGGACRHESHRERLLPARRRGSPLLALSARLLWLGAAILLRESTAYGHQTSPAIAQDQVVRR